MEKTLTCIGCPIGCLLAATTEADQIIITGNACKIGKDYGLNEMTHPRRTLTANVTITGAALPILSVKTKTDIPKSQIMDCVDFLKTVRVQAPVTIGDVVVQNICGCGVDVVATKTINEKEKQTYA